MDSEARDNASAPRTGIGRGRGRNNRPRAANDEARAAPEQPRNNGRGRGRGKNLTFIDIVSDQIYRKWKWRHAGQNNNNRTNVSSNDNARTDDSNNNSSSQNSNDQKNEAPRRGRGAHGRKNSDENNNSNRPIVESHLQKMVKAQQQKWSEKEEIDDKSSKSSRVQQNVQAPLDLNSFSEATREVQFPWILREFSLKILSDSGSDRERRVRMYDLLWRHQKTSRSLELQPMFQNFSHFLYQKMGKIERWWWGR